VRLIIQADINETITRWIIVNNSMDAFLLLLFLNRSVGFVTNLPKLEPLGTFTSVFFFLKRKNTRQGVPLSTIFLPDWRSLNSASLQTT